MALKEYEVTIEGRRPHTTTMLLNEADAKRYGVLGQEKANAAPTKKARGAGNKSRGASNKSATTAAGTPGTGAAE